MKIQNEKELIEAIKELFSLKELEGELEDKISEVNKAIKDYLKDVYDG